MADLDVLAAEFEEHRQRLAGLAYNLLGSTAEAEDAVQESWLRLMRADSAEIFNLGGWLTTVVSRVCLDILRSRTTRPESSTSASLPDPIVTPLTANLEQDFVLSDQVGFGLLVVMETLDPAERLAFVLHDVFAIPFDDVAVIVERSPVAVRKLASRARRRLQDGLPAVRVDLREQRRVADAFLEAARDGDFERLLSVLDPEIELRADGGALANATRVVRGARAVLAQAQTFSRGLTSEVVLVNGDIGFLSRRSDGRPFSVVGLTITDGTITRMDILADPERIARLDLTSGTGA
jgi:RNA polymerase sigma factor (sigma-70 family)